MFFEIVYCGIATDCQCLDEIISMTTAEDYEDFRA